jgi:hypothetical protein
VWPVRSGRPAGHAYREAVHCGQSGVQPGTGHRRGGLAGVRDDQRQVGAPVVAEIQQRGDVEQAAVQPALPEQPQRVGRDHVLVPTGLVGEELDALPPGGCRGHHGSREGQVSTHASPVASLPVRHIEIVMHPRR